MRFAALIAFLLIAAPAVSRGEQYANNGQVVHTRLAPVVAHKIVPPFRGTHVYQGGRGNRR
jgi:hypothetical protein